MIIVLVSLVFSVTANTCVRVRPGNSLQNVHTPTIDHLCTNTERSPLSLAVERRIPLAVVGSHPAPEGSPAAELEGSLLVAHSHRRGKGAAVPTLSLLEHGRLHSQKRNVVKSILSTNKQARAGLWHSCHTQCSTV